MKTIVVAFLIILVAGILTSFTYYHDGTTRYEKITVDIQEKTVSGHKYVVATSTCSGGSVGISMVHSEACPCKKSK